MTRPSLVVAALALGLGVGLPAAAGANVDAELRKGRDLYFQGQFEQARAVFDAAVSLRAATNAQRVVAYRFQAYILFVLGQTNEAERVWLQLLDLEPNYTINPVEAAPEMVSFFAKLEPRTKTLPAEHTPEPPPRAKLTTPTTEPPPAPAQPVPPPRGCGTMGCLLPFGAGQFLNRRPIKGTIFAASELGFLAANIALYWSLRVELDRYGDYRDEASANRRFVMQHVFLGLFAATLVSGIVDAFVFP